MAQRRELLAEASLEAHRELGVHVRHDRRLARQRGEEGLDAAVHVAAREVENAHQWAVSERLIDRSQSRSPCGDG